MSGKLKVLDLFSGIGGFSLGLERTGGFETVAFCEIEPFCQKVLAKHWPKVPIFYDVRTLEYDGAIDVITGGYPCQPFSLAGKRDGQKDDRHLWPEMFRLIAALKPRWVIGENVAGHISMGLDDVLSDLETANYSVQAFVIPACAVNAPHRRERVWIIAHANSFGWRPGYGGAGQRENPEFGGIRENVADAICVRGRSRNSEWENAIHVDPCGKTFRTGDYGSWWAVEPRVGRVVNGLSGRMDRLKALGGAVVPQIPELIGNAILQSMTSQPIGRTG